MFDRVYCPGKSSAELSWEQFLATPARGTPGAPVQPMSALLQRLLDEKRPNALFVSPHAAMHPDLPTLIGPFWKSVPDDWDVVCLGAYFQSPPTHIAGHAFRPTGISAVHGFALRDRAAQALLQRPIGDATETALNALIRDGNFNVYALWPNLICPSDASTGSADRFHSFRKLGQHGRTGNQFFQVAATLGSAVRHGYRPQFPLWNTSQILSEHFDQQLDVRRIAGTYEEPDYHFAPIPSTPDLDLFGFFQSPKYFAGCENLIRQYLAPAAKLRDAVSDRFASLLAKPTVALHVRRADYVGLTHAFAPLSIDYYRAAMRHYPSDSHFVAFSDDPAWCRIAFKDDPVEVISGNPGYADLYLMAACRHQIIANSSFSWWAAYLNPNPEKRVVAPKTWFGPALSQNDMRDLFPSEWITI
jgi:hypothetical protein